MHAAALFGLHFSIYIGGGKYCGQFEEFLEFFVEMKTSFLRRLFVQYPDLIKILRGFVSVIKKLGKSVEHENLIQFSRYNKHFLTVNVV